MHFIDEEKVLRSDLEEMLESTPEPVDVSEEVDKRLKILIAEEELRKRQERERILNLEKIKNDSFQKKLQKMKTEIEYQELLKQAKLREVKMLELENEKMSAEEEVLNEVKMNAVEMLRQKNSVSESINFNETMDQEVSEIEYRKQILLKELEEKKRSLKEKSDEITRIINLSKMG